MVSRPQINAAQFARFVGLAEASSTIEVSTDEDFGAVPRLIPTAVRPNRAAKGRTVPAKRARPKIDHIPCPWLIRRFDDPNAVYLFVQASEASAVAERFAATSFDVEDGFSHRDERCTPDTMLEEFGLRTEPLRHLPTIGVVDTAVSISRKKQQVCLQSSSGIRHGSEQLSAAASIYDGFSRLCRDATNGGHNLPKLKARNLFNELARNMRGNPIATRPRPEIGGKRGDLPRKGDSHAYCRNSIRGQPSRFDACNGRKHRLEEY